MTLAAIRRMNEAAIAILELELLGYTFTLDGESIHYTHNGATPDPAAVYPLLEVIKGDRDSAAEYLRRRTAPVDIPARLFEATDKSADLARLHERSGDFGRARAEWKRFARLYAAFAEETGVEPSGIPWDQWVESFEK